MPEFDNEEMKRALFGDNSLSLLYCINIYWHKSAHTHSTSQRHKHLAVEIGSSFHMCLQGPQNNYNE
jgi:hypothetical protein